jgi:hypothetical protein
MNKIKTCECGNKYVASYHPNSTIPRSKKCPKCQYASVYEKSNLAQKSSDKSRTRKKSKSFDFYTTTAWKWFSHYTLLYYANSDLVVFCATSGKPMLITSKECHCGHYVKVRDMNNTNYSVALNFHNVGPQSHRDNTHGGGRQDLMREWLVKQHGEEAIQEVERLKKFPQRPDSNWLKENSDKYRIMFHQLCKDRGIVNPWRC